MKRSLLTTAAVLAILLLMTSAAPFTVRSKTPLAFEVKATQARLNRKVLGPVTADIDGIAAEPVHSFVWDGDGSVPLDDAEATLEIDPIANTGEIKAEWTDPDGNEWAFRQTAFAPPHHAVGLRVGPDASATTLLYDDPVPTNVYLHGNSTAGGPVLPVVFNLIATWGPAEVTLNGEPFENPYDGPTPLWVAHTMTTEGVRDNNGQVKTVDGEIYNPTQRANGAVDLDDLEFHLVFHDAPGPEGTANFPPPLAFFYHLTFEDVKVEIENSG